MIAYGLRADYAGTVEQHHPADADHEEAYTVEVPLFTGGQISYGDGATFDVRDALDSDPHPGVIVIDEGNHGLVLALDEYPALKRVSAPDDADPVEASVTGYATSTLEDLRAEARRRGLKGYSGLRREVLERALGEHDRRLAAGGTTASDAQPAEDHEVRILEDGELETPADRAGAPGVNNDDTPEA